MLASFLTVSSEYARHARGQRETRQVILVVRQDVVNATKSYEKPRCSKAKVDDAGVRLAVPKD
jgi:hypothetical protein